MACKASFELYHNFPKLAEEAGFAFSTHRPRVHIEWNKIRLLDIESLIRERNFVLIEQHLNDILDCVLESEFDVRILDVGVVKIFRLAQLAVEYQQFCRHYLDRSVYVLREEVTSLAQELEANKRSLREKEEDIRRLKRKSKHVIRTPVPYGNENIATMILNTLKNQSDIFHTAPHLDTLQQNKCNICDKVFLNQLYLKSHISRRHPNVTEIPQKDVPSQENLSQINSNDNSKVLNEIEYLKNKLKEMENLISEKCNNNAELEKTNSYDEKKQDNPVKEMKDAEVLTQSQELETVKIEEWKKLEFDKYNQELNLLRTQLLQIIDANKENKNSHQLESDNTHLKNLQATIKQQAEELLTLKQELNNSKSLKENREAERKKEIETQIAEWAKKVELQSSECRSLLQKLNEMAKDVQEYRAIANSERDKAEKLQQLLNQQFRVMKQDKKVETIKPVSITKNSNIQNKKGNSDKGYPTADRVTLEKLQKKAQELLSLEHTSTSDRSTASEESNKIVDKKTNTIVGAKNKDVSSFDNSEKQLEYKIALNKNIPLEDKQQSQKAIKGFINKKGKKKFKSSSKKQNGPVTLPVSPVKVVRAKITEEVNQRLVKLGVDPLTNRLAKTAFHKQRYSLQKLQEVKIKKYPSREKIYHSIQAHLDANTSSMMRVRAGKSEKIDDSPTKTTKIFSLTSVLSNVKTKALSLVKSTEKTKKYDTNNQFKSALLENSPASARSSVINSKEITPTPSPNRGSQKKETKNRRSKKEASSKKHVLQNQTESSNESESGIDNRRTISDPELESIDDIVKSPVRKPNDSNFKRISKDYNISDNSAYELKNSKITKNIQFKDSGDNSSDDIESLVETSPRKAFSEENISPKQTKSVLKNASSTSSLNKKKVLFDMDAIQMKSVSATPSQSLAEKSDGNENYSLGIINLDTEEWDPSSIENEHPKKSTIQVNTRTSPKIAELKQAIESQMSRRIQTPSTTLAGSVNLLPTPMVRTSLGGSNTSLGSSILDESENQIAGTNNQRQPIIVKQNINKNVRKQENDDSEIDFSEFLPDDKSDNKF
ncbi:zinc finger protein DZIP1L [Zerene cesonia]|uniref:zinc finger protein DZIP1L n=1 Tax=Zerene cesonia TaxID=33412 RepID=UPI0018E55C6A|nr:zinc finger protein DZIP1L [Zerene cesonia]